MKTLTVSFALILCVSRSAVSGEVGPPQPLGPCNPKQCSSSRLAGFEAAVNDLAKKHKRNEGLAALARELRGKKPPAQNEAIRGFFAFEPKMDIEDVEDAIARRTVTGQEDPLSREEVAMLADLWVGAKE